KEAFHRLVDLISSGLTRTVRVHGDKSVPAPLDRGEGDAVRSLSRINAAHNGHFFKIDLENSVGTGGICVILYSRNKGGLAVGGKHDAKRHIVDLHSLHFFA